MEDHKEDDSQSLDPELKDKLWMLRRCDWYNEEFKDCISIRGRFHQYFVYGETLDCSQWRRDALNCLRYEDNKDINALKSLVDSELDRRNKRLSAHYANDVWKPRREPPPNWNSPLPEWMQKANENTFLDIKSKEEKEEIANPLERRQSYCTIM